jgi:riboflavin biosynthesis pyrimidine reductase
MADLIKLFPRPVTEIPLQGTYLAHELRSAVSAAGHAFVYANFVASIDGRIAVPGPYGEGLQVPEAIANERDWRLFQELVAQADVVISSGRYLREWAAGRAQEILRVDDPRFADLRAWRQVRGLPPQPDIAIVSRSLAFPIPEVLTAGGRRVVFFTAADPDPARVAEIETRAGKVFVAGDKGVNGGIMVERLTDLGYGTVYSAAGPRVLHLLLAGRVLDQLYLTHANRLLGGDPVATILEGPLLEPAVDLKIETIYLDPAGVDGLGQLFLSYSVRV